MLKMLNVLKHVKVRIKGYLDLYLSDLCWVQRIGMRKVLYPALFKHIVELLLLDVNNYVRHSDLGGKSTQILGLAISASLKIYIHILLLNSNVIILISNQPPCSSNMPKYILKKKKL